MIVFPLDPFSRVEGGDGIVKGSHVADVCTQPTIPDPLDDFTQLGAIGYDDEVDRQARSAGRASGRPGDGHQRSSGANHARRRFPMSPPRGHRKPDRTPPTSARASLSRSMNSVAPSRAPSDGRQRARCR